MLSTCTLIEYILFNLLHSLYFSTPRSVVLRKTHIGVLYIFYLLSLLIVIKKQRCERKLQYYTRAIHGLGPVVDSSPMLNTCILFVCLFFGGGGWERSWVFLKSYLLVYLFIYLFISIYLFVKWTWYVSVVRWKCSPFHCSTKTIPRFKLDQTKKRRYVNNLFKINTCMSLLSSFNRLIFMYLASCLVRLQT